MKNVGDENNEQNWAQKLNPVVFSYNRKQNDLRIIISLKKKLKFLSKIFSM